MNLKHLCNIFGLLLAYGNHNIEILCRKQKDQHVAPKLLPKNLLMGTLKFRRDVKPKKKKTHPIS
jgi:hypothetical protein